MRDTCNLSLLRYILVLEGITRLYLGLYTRNCSYEGEQEEKVPMHETIRRESLNYLTRETSIIAVTRYAGPA